MDYKQEKSKSPLYMSGSKVPPKNVVKVPIIKQNPLLNIIYNGYLSKYGLMQLSTYHKTKRRFGNTLCPYRPSIIPEKSSLYDFHMHTCYSDGTATYKQILDDIVQKNHLDGLAITDHPFHLTQDGKKRILDEKVLKRSYRFKKLVNDYKAKGKIPEHFTTFPGSCEFFMRLSEEYPNDIIEIIALGLPEDFIANFGGVKKIANSYAQEFMEKVHEENGLIILPHPFYMVRSHAILKKRKVNQKAMPDAVETINYTVGFMADKSYNSFFNKLPFPKQLKAIMSNFGYFNWMTTVVSQKNDYGKDFDFPVARKIAQVGNSDGHFRNMIGAASTLIKTKIENLEDLRKIFHKKATLPIYNKIWSQNTEIKQVYHEI